LKRISFTYLERVHLKLLPWGPHRGAKSAEPSKSRQYRSAEYRTFKHALPWRQSDPTPPLPAIFAWPMAGSPFSAVSNLVGLQVFQLLLGVHLCLHQGSALRTAMANIGRGAHPAAAATPAAPQLPSTAYYQPTSAYYVLLPTWGPKEPVNQCKDCGTGHCQHGGRKNQSKDFSTGYCQRGGLENRQCKQGRSGGRGHRPATRPPNQTAQGPSWTPRTTPSPSQLLTGPMGGWDERWPIPRPLVPLIARLVHTSQYERL
jgi:hypothetical protein